MSAQMEGYSELQTLIEDSQFCTQIKGTGLSFGDMQIYLPCLQYNGTRWHLACGAQSGKKKIHLKNSTAVSLSRNHDLVTQDNPQALL